MSVSSTTSIVHPGYVTRNYNSTQEVRITIPQNRPTIQNNNQLRRPLIQRNVRVIEEESCFCDYLRQHIIWVPVFILSMVIVNAICLSKNSNCFDYGEAAYIGAIAGHCWVTAGIIKKYCC
jgi:hypothetical protein